MTTTYTLTATVTGSITTLNKRTDEMGTTQEAKTTTQTSSYAAGYGDNQVKQHYRIQTTVANGVPLDLDLYNSLTDVFGQTIIFENVRAVLVRNRSAVDSDYINFGPLGVGNGWTDPFDGDADGKMRVCPSGAVLLDAPLDRGYEITPTSQALRIAWDGVSSTITVQVELIGVSGTLESSSSSSCSGSSLSSSSQCTSSASTLSSPMCSESTSSMSCSSTSSISSQG